MLFDFASQGLVVKEYGVSFLYVSKTFEKIGLCQKGNLDKSYSLSQAAACDGNKYTTTASGQETVPGTLPIYYI